MAEGGGKSADGIESEMKKAESAATMALAKRWRASSRGGEVAKAENGGEESRLIWWPASILL